MVDHHNFSLFPLGGADLCDDNTQGLEAETLIMIVPQKVPEDYVRSIVSMSMEDRLRTIKQQITSRTNLEDNIKKHQLFFDPPADKMFLEEKVTILWSSH